MKSVALFNPGSPRLLLAGGWLVLAAELWGAWQTAPAPRGVPDASRDKVHVLPSVFLELQLLGIVLTAGKTTNILGWKWNLGLCSQARLKSQLCSAPGAWNAAWWMLKCGLLVRSRLDLQCLPNACWELQLSFSMRLIEPPELSCAGEKILSTSIQL